MKKRRSTVYVRPGKDVTLYIPSDTPPEVIDYLNRLKAEGAFSQGVIDVITAYVQQRRSAAGTTAEELPDYIGHAGMSGVPFETENLYDERDSERTEDAVYAVQSKKLNFAEIFLQSKKNSGKLLDRPGGE